MNNKEPKLKDIEFNDVYTFAEILKTLKLDIPEEELEKMEKMGIRSGIVVAKSLLGELKSSKTEMNNFLGHMFGMSGEEFGHLGLKDMASVMRQLKKLKESGELLDFFDAAAQLIS